MMPFSKENNRRIYITALVISFLLIVGSIYLHMRQKTHLGRMNFNLDRDLVKPTGGVETTTWLDEYYSREFNESSENSYSKNDRDEGNDITEFPSPADVHYTGFQQVSSDEASSVENIQYTGFQQVSSDEALSVEDINYGSYHKDLSQYVSNENTNEDDGDEYIKQSSEYELKPLEQNSTGCVRCLCMTVNECRPTFCGSGNPCGLYRITKSYWMDAGKPTIAGGTTDNEDQDYLTCVNEDTCSTTVIRQYYNRYKRDCNKDGALDCHDQIALHLLGPTGCLTQNLSYIHANRLKNCFIESNLNYYQYTSEEEY